MVQYVLNFIKVELFFLLYFLISLHCAWKLRFSPLSSSHSSQRYTYRVLQTIQMKLILLCVWTEWAILGSAKTVSKFKYET